MNQDQTTIVRSAAAVHNLRRPAPLVDHRVGAAPAAASRCEAGVRTIVLGYDGSQAARRALTRAAEAAGSDGLVIVVSAVPPADVRAREPGIDSLLSEPEDLIRQASALLRGYDVAIRTRIREAEPAEALVTTALETGAALIVVGARGDSYLARALRGSVAEKLVAHSPCDLLVVP